MKRDKKRGGRKNNLLAPSLSLSSSSIFQKKKNFSSKGNLSSSEILLPTRIFISNRLPFCSNSFSFLADDLSPDRGPPPRYFRGRPVFKGSRRGRETRYNDGGGSGNIIPRYGYIYIYIIRCIPSVAVRRVQCSKERRMQFQRVI